MNTDVKLGEKRTHSIIKSLNVQSETKIKLVALLYKQYVLYHCKKENLQTRPKQAFVYRYFFFNAFDAGSTLETSPSLYFSYHFLIHFKYFINFDFEGINLKMKMK